MKTQSKNRNPLHGIGSKLVAGASLLLLSSAVARADYQSTVLASHPVGYWPLNLTVDTNKDASTGNYIATDLSGNNNFGEYNNISPNNGQDASGPSPYIPSAVVFNGNNTYVDLSLGSNADLMQIVGPITMEAWVQPTIPQLRTSGSSGEYGLILSKGYDLSEDVDNIDLDIRSDDNEQSYLYWGGVYTSFNGLDQQSATGGFQATTNWTHVVATWDYSGIQTTNGATNGLWSLYVNGVLVAANQAVGPSLYAGPPYLEGIPFTDAWAIGSGTADGGAPNWREFSGSICQVALYANALTPGEVLDHYNAGLYGAAVVPAVPAGLTAYETNVLASHPVGYWPLNLTIDTNKDAATGQYIATDLSGYNNFGEYVNIAPNNGQGASGPSAYIPNGVLFNGNNTYVDLTLGANADLMQVVGPITMEAWVQPNIPQLRTSGSGGEYGLILSKGYDLSEDVDNIDLDIRSDNNEQSYQYWGGVYTSFNSLDQQSATGGFATTNWTHVVATWKYMGPESTNGLWSLYVNGVLVNANTAVGPTLYASPYAEGMAFTDGWAIGNGTADGGAPNWREFSGGISQVALYTNALTANEVLTHYNLGLYGTNTTISTPPAITAQSVSYQSIVLASHPVGYWPLDLSTDTNKDVSTGNYIAADLSGFNNFGEYNNIAPNNGQNASGPSLYIPNAVVFNGNNTYVDLSPGSNADLMQIVGPITMEAWVQPTIPQLRTSGSGGEYGLILSKGYDLSEDVDNIDLDIRSDDNEQSYLYWGGVYTSFNSLDQQSATGGFQATTNWTHVVATWDYSGIQTTNGATNGLWSLYVNGNLVAANQAVGPSLYAGPPYLEGIPFTDAWAIGSGTADGGAPNWREFSGSICQVALYTNALTANEVLEHYNVGVYGATVVPAVPAGLTAYQTNVLASHPVGYWPLNLAIDTKKDAVTGQYIATDLSGYNNFGEYVNIAPNNGQSASGPSPYIPNAVAFNGNNTYVDLTLGANADLLQIVGPITMEAWVQPAIPQLLTSGSGGEYGLILSKGYDLSEDVDNIDLDIRSDDNEKSYVYWGGVYTSFNGLDQQSATGGFATTNWTHVVATWQFVGPETTNGLWSLYVNGLLVNANTAVGPTLYASPYAEGMAFTDGWAIGNGTADGGALNWREFSGSISQVALYTNALTAGEVLTHYNLGLYGNAGLPTLSMARGASGSVVVSWRASVSTAYGLQQSPTVLGPWSGVTAVPVLTNSQYQVTLTSGSRNAFYRLKLQ